MTLAHAAVCGRHCTQVLGSGVSTDEQSTESARSEATTDGVFDNTPEDPGELIGRGRAVRIVRAVEVGAPTPVVWELVSVFRYWPLWGPSVTGIESEWCRVGPGVTGKVATPVGVSLPFEITSVEEGVSWGWKVAGVMATGHRLEATSEHSCRVEFSVPGHFAPYAVVLRRGLDKLADLAASDDPLGSPDVDGHTR